MRDPSDQSTEIPLKSLPRTLEEATRMVRKLGYTKAQVYALESDRLAAVTRDGYPFTLAFQYDPNSESVKVIELDGWPVE